VTDALKIPQNLLPADGRFGSGPAKIRPEAARALADSPLLGTSHRKAPVKNLVAHIQESLAQLYRLPDDYQVVLGNGGATQLWDIACCSLIEHRSAHGVFGEFSRKFAKAAAKAPFLGDPVVFEADNGGLALPKATADVDVYAWAQNETSTGACAPVSRPEGIGEALVLVDATSAAGGMDADISQTDAYYFAPQKNFSSDGGLWIAFCSPAALARAQRLTTDRPGNRWVPDTLNLATAASNSAKNQTLNTPAIATLILIGNQLDWLLANGGIEFAVQRTTANSNLLYDWVERTQPASCIVADPAHRSPVVVTIGFDPSIDADALCAVMRQNGIVDIEPYRSLGRNSIRVGVYAPVDPADVQALIACLDWVLPRLAN
jgi:phosphoserine aminotransferase